MTTTQRVPATLDEATAELTQIGQLATATEWRRAAIVASFVQLDAGHGGRETANSRRLSASAFAARGIVGLRTHDTVARYVRAWLDEHEQQYPEPGALVELPDKTWPPTRTGTDGYESFAGVAKTVAKIVAKHGPSAVAAALDDDAAAQVAAQLSSRVREHRHETLPAPDVDVRELAHVELTRAIDTLDHSVNRVEVAMRAYADGVPDELVAMLSRSADRLGLVLDLARGFDAAWQAQS